MSHCRSKNDFQKLLCLKFSTKFKWENDKIGSSQTFCDKRGSSNEPTMTKEGPLTQNEKRGRSVPETRVAGCRDSATTCTTTLSTVCFNSLRKTQVAPKGGGARPGTQVPRKSTSYSRADQPSAAVDRRSKICCNIGPPA